VNLSTLTAYIPLTERITDQVGGGTAGGSVEVSVIPLGDPFPFSLAHVLVCSACATFTYSCTQIAYTPKINFHAWLIVDSHWLFLINYRTYSTANEAFFFRFWLSETSWLTKLRIPQKSRESEVIPTSRHQTATQANNQSAADKCGSSVLRQSNIQNTTRTIRVVNIHNNTTHFRRWRHDITRAHRLPAAL